MGAFEIQSLSGPGPACPGLLLPSRCLWILQMCQRSDSRMMPRLLFLILGHPSSSSPLVFILQDSSSGSLPGWLHCGQSRALGSPTHCVWGCCYCACLLMLSELVFVCVSPHSSSLGLHLHISSALLHSLACTRCSYMNEVHLGIPCSCGASQSLCWVPISSWLRTS